LPRGLILLHEEDAVFEAMLDGWAKQQLGGRGLRERTVRARQGVVRRFLKFTNEYPWSWGPSHVDEWTQALTSERRLAPSTIRGYHLVLRMFCDYLTDARYDWPRQCRDRFDQVPVQVCHEWNTVAHLNEYEGRPARRPLTYDVLQVLFDYLDERVERVAGSGRPRKGKPPAIRRASEAAAAAPRRDWRCHYSFQRTRGKRC